MLCTVEDGESILFANILMYKVELEGK